MAERKGITLYLRSGAIVRFDDVWETEFDKLRVRFQHRIPGGPYTASATFLLDSLAGWSMDA